MGKCLGKIFIITLPFVLLYVILGHLYKNEHIGSVYQSLLTILESIGDQSNIWLSITTYFNNTFLPAWKAITNGSDPLTWISSIFTLLYAPLQLSFEMLEDVFSIITTIIQFLSFNLTT